MNCVLFAKMDQVFSKENKTLKKILENWKKILEKSGNFVSPEKWERWLRTVRILLECILVLKSEARVCNVKS